jgi:uncharacterized protein DUF4331
VRGEDALEDAHAGSPLTRRGRTQRPLFVTDRARPGKLWRTSLLMRSPRKLIGGLSLLAIAGTVAAIGAGPLLVSGADHLDSPLVKTDARVDLTDLYAFRTSATTTALALNVNPLTAPADTKAARFRQGALYEIKIDSNGNGLADIAYRIKFSSLQTFSDGTNNQTFTVKRATGAAARRTEWSGTTVAVGKTSRYGGATRVATVLGGGSAFAGPRDDPFFFDLVGFKHLKSRVLAGRQDLGTVNDTANCALADDDASARLLSCFTGSDTFAGTNVSSIVLKLPNSKLGGTGHTVGIWATTAISTKSGWQRIDRLGRPAINTVFNITDGEKDLSNLLNPADDRSTMKDTTVAVLSALSAVVVHAGATGYTPAQINAIANVLLPDMLTIKLGNNAGFLNGRKPADDVINAEFSLVTNGALTSDGVNANDKAFLHAFPYLATPH